jgi:hypothetical protein
VPRIFLAWDTVATADNASVYRKHSGIIASLFYSKQATFQSRIYYIVPPSDVAVTLKYDQLMFNLYDYMTVKQVFFSTFAAKAFSPDYIAVIFQLTEAGQTQLTETETENTRETETYWSTELENNVPK